MSGYMNLPLLFADAANTFFGLGVVGLCVALALLLFSVWMLVDALTNASLSSTMRVVWAVVIFFAPFLGAVAYFIVARNPVAKPRNI
jgi:hypothetical protein